MVSQLVAPFIGYGCRSYYCASNEVNSILNVELDTDNAIPVGSAGGGKFYRKFPSKKKIEIQSLNIVDLDQLYGKGIVYFCTKTRSHFY